MEYERGVLIDREGFVVASVRWEAGTPRPGYPRQFPPIADARPGRSVIGDNTEVIMLTEDYAVDNVELNARWDFTPVFDEDDGSRVRSGTWLLPTERRWVVGRRRDVPDIWFLRGSRLVWPERLPDLGEDVLLVATEPPQSRSQRPVWDSTAGAWLMPRRVAVLAADGEVLNFTSAYRDDDMPDAPGGVVTDDESLTGEDEIGETVRCAIGDVIDTSGGNPVVTIRCLPRYRRVPIRFLQQALQNANQLQNFLTFIEAEGFTAEDLERLGSISLRNRLLRQFVSDQGFTMRQAYNAIQRAAEDAQDGEDEARRGIGVEVVQ